MRIGSRGFTLAEVLIAVLIVGIGVLGLIGVRIYALKGSQSSPNQQTASLLAASLMAEAEERIALGEPLDEIARNLNETPSANPRFSHQVELYLDRDAPAPNKNLDNLVHANVVIKWKNRERDAVYRLHTRIARI